MAGAGQRGSGSGWLSGADHAPGNPALSNLPANRWMWPPNCGLNAQRPASTTCPWDRFWPTGPTLTWPFGRHPRADPQHRVVFARVLVARRARAFTWMPSGARRGSSARSPTPPTWALATCGWPCWPTWAPTPPFSRQPITMAAPRPWASPPSRPDLAVDGLFRGRHSGGGAGAAGGSGRGGRKADRRRCPALWPQRHGYRFAGIDFSLAPFPEEARSIGAAIEQLGVDRFGAPGTLFAASLLTGCLRQAQYHAAALTG